MFPFSSECANWDNSRYHRACLEWRLTRGNGRFLFVLGSPPRSRHRIRSISLGIILITLPFYCLGFMIWGLSSPSEGGQRIQSSSATPEATHTPMVFTATPTATPVPTRPAPSATPFPIPQIPATARPFIPPSIPAPTATESPSATASLPPTPTRRPLLPPTDLPGDY